MESVAHNARQALSLAHRPPVLAAASKRALGVGFMHPPLVVLCALGAVLACAFVWRLVHFFRGLKGEAPGAGEP